MAFDFDQNLISDWTVDISIRYAMDYVLLCELLKDLLICFFFFVFLVGFIHWTAFYRWRCDYIVHKGWNGWTAAFVAHNHTLVTTRPLFVLTWLKFPKWLFPCWAPSLRLQPFLCHFEEQTILRNTCFGFSCANDI